MELLNTEPPLYIKWVTKRKRDKVQERLIVVGKFRIFSIKKTLTGKKKVQRVGHLFDLVGINSTDVDRLILKFKDFDIDIQEPGAGTDLVTTIRKALQRITCSFAEYAVPKITLLPPERVLQPLPEIDYGPANGLVYTYEAFCDYYTSPTSQEFIKFVTDLATKGNTALHMDQCPGIERKENAIDFTPIRAALRHNTYFTTFAMKKVPRKEITVCMADTLLHNVTFQSLILSGVDAQEVSATALGTAIKKNTHNALTELDVSSNPNMKEKGAIGLADGLQNLQHSLIKLNLACCSFNPKASGAILQALCFGKEVSRSLQEVDLSYNNIGQPGSVQIANWFNQQDSCRNLRYLILTATKLDVGMAMRAVKNGRIATLVELDVSFNKIDLPGGQAVAGVIEQCPNIQIINVTNCSMQSGAAVAILTAVASNNSVKDVRINLSYNELGIQGAANIAQVLANCSNIGALILRSCGFKKEGLFKLADALGSNTSLKLFDLSLNFREGSSAKMSKLIQSLAQSVLKHPTLEHLALAGDEKKFFIGKDLVPLFQALPHARLQELDISGNKIGDILASTLCDALRDNSHLKYLFWDRNLISIGGWQALLNIVQTNNHTLSQCPTPHFDLEKAVKDAKNKEQFKERAKQVLDNLKDALKKNTNGQGYTSQHIKARAGRSYTILPSDGRPVSIAYSAPQTVSYDDTGYYQQATNAEPLSYEYQQSATSYGSFGMATQEANNAVSNSGYFYPPPPPAFDDSYSAEAPPPPSFEGSDQYSVPPQQDNNNTSYSEFGDQARAEGSFLTDYKKLEFDDSQYEDAPPPPPPPPF